MLSLRQFVADAKHAVAEQAPEDQEIPQGNLLLLRTEDYSDTLIGSPRPSVGEGLGGGEYVVSRNRERHSGRSLRLTYLTPIA